MASARERTLSLLAQAGAEFQSKLTAHDVEREVFDALPGEEQYSDKTGGGRLFWKGGRVGGLEWSVFTRFEPVAAFDVQDSEPS